MFFKNSTHKIFNMHTSLPEILSPCAGVIVINVDEKKTVLVCTSTYFTFSIA